MLKTYRAGAVALAALLGITASAAAAEQYEILMMENAFFPDVTYVQEGDIVTFVNMSGITRTVKAVDATWTTVQLQDGESFALAIEGTMHEAFQASLNGDNSATGEEIGNGDGGALTDDNIVDGVDQSVATQSEAELIFGNLDFSPPPTTVSQ